MIYYVEDDDNIRELVIYTLENTGLHARGCDAGEAFWQAMEQEKPELILLDVMLPGEDGISILKRLRQNPETRGIPVIMATAKGSEYDKVTALDLGADDYVTKPYGMMELVSRIKAVLRRIRSQKEQEAEGTGQESATGTADEMLSYGGIFMNTRKHEVSIEGKEVVLTLKEYDFLKKLMLNPDTVLTREQILNDVWGYEFDGETRTVDVHVRTLRQKLGEQGNMIETVRGVGYRLSNGL